MYQKKQWDDCFITWLVCIYKEACQDKTTGNNEWIRLQITA